MRIGLINYGSGNFTSVWNALRHLELDPVEVAEPGAMVACTHLILPGVGTFPDCMEKLEAKGFVAALRREVLEQKKPYLGICLGMQILADVGYEFRECRGLGFIPGRVPLIQTGASRLPVPHMGWNDLKLSGPCPLFAGLGEAPAFYFVHSFHVLPDDPAAVAATAEYGEPVTACIQRGHIFGVQFHPEKSQGDGLRLLRNFSEFRSTVQPC